MCVFGCLGVCVVQDDNCVRDCPLHALPQIQAIQSLYTGYVMLTLIMSLCFKTAHAQAAPTGSSVMKQRRMHTVDPLPQKEKDS